MMGTLGESTVFASETCAFDLLDARFEREIEPGEMVVVNERGMRRSLKPFAVKPTRQCIFEHIYFARPDGIMFGEATELYRERLGAALARESGVEADIVVPVPDSGVYAAVGYARESEIPFSFGLIRNHYVGRTFIEPKQSIRHFGVKIKLNPVRGLIEGKRVILVDDSLVRGTTSRKIVKMLRRVGATEVHMRISAPPTTPSLFLRNRYTDTQRADRLIPHHRGDSPLYRSRFPQLYLHGWDSLCSGELQTRALLPRLLLRRLSPSVPL